MSNDQESVLAQEKRRQEAVKEHRKLVATLENLSLSPYERRRLKKLKDRSSKIEKEVWSEPNTAGISFQLGEVIIDNVEVRMKVLARLERSTEGIEQINQALQEMISQYRRAAT
ncbi:MAG: hypothetical protein IVW54_10765 [Candidatus Binataceae bacterium]|nr:hypothetical protein [Candidatus Binataceae bacterium]